MGESILMMRGDRIDWTYECNFTVFEISFEFDRNILGYKNMFILCIEIDLVVVEIQTWLYVCNTFLGAPLCRSLVYLFSSFFMQMLTYM
jgi:hypothetical protein